MDQRIKSAIASVLSVFTVLGGSHSNAQDLVPDASFGQNGFSVLEAPAGLFAIRGLETDSEGRIILLGETSQSCVLQRMLGNGSPDTNFGSSGTAIVSLSQTVPGSLPFFCAEVTTFQSDDALIVGNILADGDPGPGFLPSQTVALARVSQTGELDTSLGGSGFAFITPAPTPGVASYLQADAAVSVGGAAAVIAGRRIDATSPQLDRFFVTRLTSAGTPDPLFGQEGGYTYFDIGTGESITQIVADHEGGFWIAGGVQQGIFVVKLTADGLPDQLFGGGNAFVITPPGAALFSVSGIAVNPDGAVVIGARRPDFSTPPQLFASRFFRNGASDASFGSGGFFADAFGGNITSVGGVDIDEQDRVLFAFTSGGNSPSRIHVGRLSALGNLDLSFGSGGFFSTEVNPAFFAPGSMRRDIEGRLVIAGDVSRSPHPTPAFDFNIFVNAFRSATDATPTPGPQATATVSFEPTFFATPTVVSGTPPPISGRNEELALLLDALGIAVTNLRIARTPRQAKLQRSVKKRILEIREALSNFISLYGSEIVLAADDAVLEELLRDAQTAAQSASRAGARDIKKKKRRALLTIAKFRALL